ncbi:hypothetical protein LF1_47720 [Rubripirellula obstinata]|uniref:Uncharacterized protein n=1 Tax=Rubripirellula obstinata TaxID=406547 RepID=A0A5B1CRE8_9BACT|nr:hypothetical protein LF1_47720 [Rubripirellula obstinata]
MGIAPRREEFWSRKTRVSSFNRVGIAPRVRASTTRGAMPTRLNDLETLHGVGNRPYLSVLRYLRDFRNHLRHAEPTVHLVQVLAPIVADTSLQEGVEQLIGRIA